MISGEITVDKIEQAFNREARDFVAGVVRQKEAENPLIKLQNMLKDWDRKMAASIEQSSRLDKECDAQRVSQFDSFASFKIEERISGLVGILGRVCMKHGIDLKCLTFNPPVHEKTISTVPSRALRAEEGDCNGFTGYFPMEGGRLFAVQRLIRRRTHRCTYCHLLCTHRPPGVPPIEAYDDLIPF